MAITSDILAFWRQPRRTFRPKLAEAPREDRALALLMIACFLLYVGRWPALARQAHLEHVAAEQAGLAMDQIPSLQALLGINFFVMIFVAPLFFYLLAGLTLPLMRLIRRPVQPFAARLALFWALLASAPLVLLQGLLAGLVGAGTGLTVVGVLIGLTFFWLWFNLLAEAARVHRG